MEADEIRALRKRLKLTMAQLGDKLGVPQATVIQWELGERFPTKAHVQKMRALENQSPDAPAAKPTPGESVWAPFLGAPEFGALLRKLLVHPELRARALELAREYSDPARP